VRKLAGHLARRRQRRIVIDRQRLRPILRERQVLFQRTRTWKKSRDPDKGATLDRIEVELRFTPALVLGEDQLRQSERQGDRAVPFAGVGFQNSAVGVDLRF
jgi:hypothetical protein